MNEQFLNTTVLYEFYLEKLVLIRPSKYKKVRFICRTFYHLNFALDIYGIVRLLGSSNDSSSCLGISVIASATSITGLFSLYAVFAISAALA